MKALITGADGFVGRALAAHMSTQRHQVRTAVREPRLEFANLAAQHNWVLVSVGEIGPAAKWLPALNGVEAVVHLAARVHVMRDRAVDPLAEFRLVNVQGTERLAQMAAAAGVRRFVFLSSIKVNGDETPSGVPYQADDPLAPSDAYGISKREAEDALWQLANETEMEVVVVRPPLVYGPGVKGNFLTMMRWLSRGVPLPLGAIHNKRSLVGLDNLVDLIVRCIEHPAAANQIFLAGDGEDLSTTELLTRMGFALGRPARLVPVPAWMLTTAASLIGKNELSRRLCGSLRVDISKTRALLDWTPPVSVDEGLRATAQHFLNECKHH